MKTSRIDPAKNAIKVKAGMSSQNRTWLRHQLFSTAFRKYVESLPCDSYQKEECLLSRFIEMCDKRLEKRVRAESQRNRETGFADGLCAKHGNIIEDHYDTTSSRYGQNYIAAYARGYRRRGLLIDQIVREFISELSVP